MRRVRRLVQSDENMTDTPAPHNPSIPSEWAPALEHSRYLRQLVETRPEITDWLREQAERDLDLPLMEEFLQSDAPADEDSLKRCLRRLRQRIMAALILRDIGGTISLAGVVETMTQLADFTTNYALDFLHRQLAAQFGEPLDQQGRPQRMLVIGMGKLGGRELNVSSDIDLIFLFDEEGETRAEGMGSLAHD